MILAEFGLSNSKLKFIGDRPGQVDCHIAGIEKAKDLLGWSPKMNLMEGLRKTIQWSQENPTWWQNLEWMKQVPIRSCNNVVEMH